MFRRVISALALAFLLALASAVPGRGRSPRAPSPSSPAPVQQSYPQGKTNEDYLQTILSRNTKPLGLKENVALRNLLRQPPIKWAIRAGIRHIID
jgi:hypothetical protein